MEPGGIEQIPEGERHGHPLHLFWTWLSPNLEFATVFVGVLPIAIFGGGFWTTVAGVLLGTALGSLSHGFLSAMGPRWGVPQMVLSRGPFGYVGNLLPAGLNTLTAGVGWFLVNSVSGTFALLALFSGLRFWQALLIVVVAQVGVAFAGHNFVHRFERVILPYLALVFTLAGIVVLSKANFGLGFNPKAPVAFGGESGAFSLAVFIAFGYAAGWNPYAADYTRYLPRSASRLATGLWAGLGVFVSCAALEVVGAGVATLGGRNPNPTANFTAPLGHPLGELVLVGIALGAVAANVLNIYSGAMSFLTLGVRLSLRQRRALVAVASGVLGLLIGIVYQAEVGPGTKYENFLLAIAYWITPWLAVTLADYWLRRGGYDVRLFFDAGHRPWKGALSMLAGILAAVPFWDQNDPLTPGKHPPIGAFPFAHPEFGDLSFVVGFLVAGGLYLLLNRGMRRRLAAAGGPAG